MQNFLHSLDTTHVNNVNDRPNAIYDVGGSAVRHHSRLTLLLSMLVMVCSVFYLPATAATNHDTAVENQSNALNTVLAKPDNLADYTAQKIEQIKKEGISVSEIADEVVNPLDKDAVQQAGVMQGDTGLTGDYNESYYSLNKLNAGLPPLAEPPNLSTPLATLEFFQSAVMKQQYDLAAYALNMNLIDGKLQRSRAIDLAKQLDFLLIEKKLYVFDELPDRPDGLIEPPLGSTNSIQGIPRRSIQLGYIDYRERRVPIHLERVRIDDSAPFWIFSAQTVGNIDNLYEQYHPAKFERYLPAWTKLQLFSIAIWEFLALLVFFSFTMGVGWLLSKGAGKLLNWYVKDKAGNRLSTLHHNSVEDLVNKLTVPLTFTISFSSVFTLVSGGFPYLDAVASSIRPIIWIGLVFSAMWLGIRVINFFANRYQDMQIENLGEEQFDKVRRRRTYVSIFRRVFVFVMVLGSIWIGLSEFANMEGFGKTLVTSAGIAGVVIGIAAQPILGNIIAGVQVAVTQPVRIGDSVIMDGNFSTVEDLRYTYAVLKTWDERRLIVPMRELITEMVENWSHTEVHQTCPVFLYIDYGADIDAIRQQFISVVKDNKLWDNKTEPEIFVVEVTEKTIQLRGAVSAIGPVEAWTLACEIREQMLDYLYREQKHYLPAEHLVLRQK
ncbi:mechanosensitive ion channel family protein [Psychrobacter sp. K31L]|uniref:mechanosensitive ion channel family protein n=1 Tax=Psychrobacter sp. K31L TaxID=2820758 RepID=UPI001B32FFE3|nr:mechanosensitive ion channel family protein [Psychrobacter sp. K31L]MBP3945883.1 mechanosensitive ion channel family protein [Psychrobacter sp. K31L]